MVRTQIQLTERQARELKKRAAEQGVSMATLIRDAVDAMLEADQVRARRRRAIEAAGGFHSGRSDISEEHDRYLAEDFWEEPG